MNIASGALCVDLYEASPNASCPVTGVTNAVDTQTNLNEPSCTATSVPEVQPWRFISLTQAQQLCARDGKRLPSSVEWYALALAQADQSTCVVNTNGPQLTGSARCVTTAGVFDVVGNVWEWVDGQVTEGALDGRALPESGYVTSVDQQGLVLETSVSPNAEYGDDYAKTAATGVYGIIRGGFYGSQTDGGIFAQNLAVPLDLKTDGVGFRCVRSL
jgi:formylglycine-generating enzyme required for sulfatase activity